MICLKDIWQAPAKTGAKSFKEFGGFEGFKGFFSGAKRLFGVLRSLLCFRVLKILRMQTF